MKSIVAASIVAVVFASQANARVTQIPSDDTSGGATAKLGLTWIQNEGAPWRTTNLPACVPTTGGGPISFCDTSLASDIVGYIWRTYSGRPFVTELVCATSSLITGTSTWTLRLAYRTGVSGSFTYFPGSTVFTSSESPGESHRIAINARPTLADGFFLVTTDFVVQDAADVALALRLACTVN